MREICHNLRKEVSVLWTAQLKPKIFFGTARAGILRCRAKPTYEYRPASEDASLLIFPTISTRYRKRVHRKRSTRRCWASTREPWVRVCVRSCAVAQVRLSWVARIIVVASSSPFGKQSRCMQDLLDRSVRQVKRLRDCGAHEPSRSGRLIGRIRTFPCRSVRPTVRNDTMSSAL